MTVYRKPKIKSLRRFGILPEGTSIRHKKRILKKKTDYGRQLEEKQKLKFVYKIMERQLARYVWEAFRTKGNPEEKILQTLETRLDNLIYRLGFASTRESARQMVSHGHVLVDGKKVNIPSHHVSPGEEIILKTNLYKKDWIQENLKNNKSEDLLPWLERKENKGKLRYVPKKKELPREINMSYIIGLYH